MRIAVIDVGRVFGRQTRAYAEYRVFSSVARFSDMVAAVDVSLAAPAGGRTVRCGVTVTLDEGRRVCVNARGRHVYDAINRASARVADAMRRPGILALPS